MYSFSELIDNTATLLQRQNDTEYKEKIKIWLNLSQEYLFNSYDYFLETQAKFTFSSIAAQSQYFMPQDFDKPLRIYDLTNNRKLTVWTEETYIDTNISSYSANSQGVPAYARLFGIFPVSAVFPTAGSIIKVKSSSLSDTSGIIIRVQGYIDSAKMVIDYEDITVSTGAPTLFVSGTKTFYDVISITKSDDTQGYITVADSSDNTLVILSSIDVTSRHPVISLGLTPQAVYSYMVMYKRRFHKMVNDNDYPFCEADDFYVLNAYAYGLSEEKETLGRATEIWTKANNAMMQVLRNQQTKLGESFQHKLVSSISVAHRV